MTFRFTRHGEAWCLAGIGTALYLLATRYGTAVGGDSVLYFELAQNLADGKGFFFSNFISSDPGAPVQRPWLMGAQSLYSILLAGLAATGFSMDSAARLLGALLFAAAALSTYALQFELTRSKRVSLISMAIVSSTLHYFGLFLDALTNGLLAAPMMVGFAFLLRFFRSERSLDYACTLLAFSVVALARRSGMFLLPPLFFLMYAHTRSWKLTAGLLSVLLPVASLQTALTLWGHHLPQDLLSVAATGVPAGGRSWLSLDFNSIQAYLPNLLYVLETHSPFLRVYRGPHEEVVSRWINLGTSAILLGTTLALATIHQLRPRSEHPDLVARRFAAGFLVSGLFFVALNGASVAFYLKGLLDPRYFEPAYPIFAVSLLYYLHAAANNARLKSPAGSVRLKKLLLIAAAAIVVLYVARLGRHAWLRQLEGLGFYSRPFRDSRVLAEARSLPEDQIILTNAPDLMRLYSDRRVLFVPPVLSRGPGGRLGQERRPEFDNEIERLRRFGRAHPVLFYYVENRWVGRPDRPSELECVDRLHLKKIDDDELIRVYEFAEESP